MRIVSLDSLQERCRRRLQRWAIFAERDWHDMPGRPGQGCYGSGYNAWGVQTNQKYLAAMAILADDTNGSQDAGFDRAWALDRARAALRFSLATHLSGPDRCRDQTQWGNTWISALGIERMMVGVHALEPHFDDGERDALRRVLCHEADWLLTDHRRGNHHGVFGGLWNHQGNAPESNLWNGALLWRTAVRYPDHGHADAWREQAHRFLINSVSVPADASDATPVAGRTIAERFAGANFFPNYALDHHGYLNVGYMVICISNAAILHFDCKRAGLPRPETLDHHQADLWRVVRPMIFDDGRLARIGGDSRVRYCYCQDYLPPSVLYAADHLGDPEALPLIERQLDFVEQECEFNGDGSFLSHRLPAMASMNPYYYPRLESDRAVSLAMIMGYSDWVDTPSDAANPAVTGGLPTEIAWHDPDHGAALVRTTTRLTSFAWRAHGLAQGLNLPPDAGHLAEWSCNLAGQVRFLGDDGIISGGQTAQRQLEACEFTIFPGGFLTWGRIWEGMRLSIPEGWSGTHTAHHAMVFAALPDGHTVIGMQCCRTGSRWDYQVECSGMHWNVPNDLFNAFRRRLIDANGETDLCSPADASTCRPLDSRWVNIDQRIGGVGLYGADSLVLDRCGNRRGGAFESLYVDRIGFPHIVGLQPTAPDQVVLDCGWASLANVDADQTRQFADANADSRLAVDAPAVRAVRITAMNGHTYLLAASFGNDHPAIDPHTWLTAGHRLTALNGQPVSPLPPLGARLYRIEDN